jgi:hypothetical protein
MIFFNLKLLQYTEVTQVEKFTQTVQDGYSFKKSI